MEENVVMIPDVKEGMGHWTAKVTITEVMPTLLGQQRGTRYKRYILTDDQGNSIPAVVFDSAINQFDAALHLHGVYKISNVVVKPPMGKQLVHEYSTNWVLRQSTLVRPLRNEQPNLRYFLDGIMPISLITKDMADAEEIVDIMAVVIKAEEAKPTVTQFGDTVVQRFTVVDAGLKPMKLSLWDQQVEHQGPILTSVAARFSVIVAKRVKVKDYGGPTLSSTNVCFFTVDPPIEQVSALKSWFESIRQAELSNLLVNDYIARSKKLIDGNLAKKKLVSEINVSDKGGASWASAFLQPSEGNKNLYYIGCSNCLIKVDSLVGVDYYCFRCKKDVVATVRARISMDVYDHSGRMTVGAIGSVAEEILKCDSTQLNAVIKQDGAIDLESIKKEFENRMYLVMLRRTFSNQPDAPKRFLLVAYFDDTVPDEVDDSANTANFATSSSPVLCQSSHHGSATPHVISPGKIHEISPLKRQLESVTIKAGSPAKRALFQGPDAASQADGTGVPVTLPTEDGGSEESQVDIESA